jgi:hypothetical protein
LKPSSLCGGFEHPVQGQIQGHQWQSALDVRQDQAGPPLFARAKNETAPGVQAKAGMAIFSGRDAGEGDMRGLST